MHSQKWSAGVHVLYVHVHAPAIRHFPLDVLMFPIGLGGTSPMALSRRLSCACLGAVDYISGSERQERKVVCDIYAHTR
jgi:hypothetical protein